MNEKLLKNLDRNNLTFHTKREIIWHFIQTIRELGIRENYYFEPTDVFEVELVL